MKKKMTNIAIVLILCCTSIMAQTPVKKRQVNQQCRINNGVRNGELTKAETIQIQKQQININKTKRAAKADGVVTAKERAIINRKQNMASANIYRKKHNNTIRF